jgi:hypothetical protein
LVQCQTRNRNRNISEHRISPPPRKVTADLVKGSHRIEKVTNESGREDRGKQKVDIEKKEKIQQTEMRV